MTRFIRSIQTIVRETFPNYEFLAKYRYRVVKMSGDRVDLQAVSKDLGLPDMLPVQIWPGLAGASANLTPGAIVLVEFIEGNPTMPIVSHFEPEGGGGFRPVHSFVDASERVFLGTSQTNEEGVWPVARVGDVVECLMPPVVPVSGTLSGAPFAGVLTIVDPIVGLITSGSAKVNSK
jgi:hypothetical protein